MIPFDDRHLILESNSPNVALSGELKPSLLKHPVSTSKAKQIQSTAEYVGQLYFMLPHSSVLLLLLSYFYESLKGAVSDYNIDSESWACT